MCVCGRGALWSRHDFPGVGGKGREWQQQRGRQSAGSGVKASCPGWLIHGHNDHPEGSEPCHQSVRATPASLSMAGGSPGDAGHQDQDSSLGKGGWAAS